MANLSLDQQYSNLVTALSDLNAQYNSFLNGDEDDTITLNNGKVIKTLSGVIDDLKRFKYVQKVVDQKLYSDMIAADSTLEDGLLVRVWGDTGLVNGLYRKQSAGQYTKISYKDIYDLGGVLPDPWNFIQVKANETETAENVPLIQFALPVSQTTIYDQVIKGTYKYTTQGANYQGTITADVTILITVGAQSNVVCQIQTGTRLIGSIGANHSQMSAEKIQVNRVSNLDSHTFNISFVPPSDLSNPIPGALDIRFLGVDPTVVKRAASVTGVDVVPPPQPTDLYSIYQSNK